MRSGIAGGLFVALLISVFSTPSFAQMNNKPFSFGGGSSLGISNAGRQAILIEKLEGRTPDNIRRGQFGLIEITRERGSNAIATGPDGARIPGFRGTRRAFNGEVGVFNPFFLGSSGRRSGTFLRASRITSDSIAGWTGMVNGRPGYRGRNSIDAWTSQIGG